MAIKHKKVSGKNDTADSSLIQPSNWNDEHNIEDATITPDMLNFDASPLNFNAYKAREFHFTEDYKQGDTLYYSLIGPSSAGYGAHHTIEWTNNSRIVPVTGSGRLGVVSLQTGELASAKCRLHTGAMGAFDSAKFLWLSHETVLAFVTKATVGEDYWAETGLVGNKWAATDDLGDVAGFGHFFRYKRDVGGTKWIAVNRNQDVETAVILDGTTQGGIATVDGGDIDDQAFPNYGWFRLKVIAWADPNTGAGLHADYYVNGVLCASIPTNMVTHSLAGSTMIRKTAGTTNRDLYLDFTDLAYRMRDGQERLP